MRLRGLRNVLRGRLGGWIRDVPFPCKNKPLGGRGKDIDGITDPNGTALQSVRC